MASTSNIEGVVVRAAKAIADGTIDGQKIRRMVRDSSRLRLEPSLCSEIANEARINFINGVRDGVHDLIEGDEVVERIEELKEMIDSVKDEDRRKRGWRPTGLPECDYFGHVYKFLLEHEKRLVNTETILKEQVEEKTRRLKELRQKLIDRGGSLIGEAITNPLPYF